MNGGSGRTNGNPETTDGDIKWQKHHTQRQFFRFSNQNDFVDIDIENLRSPLMSRTYHGER